MLPGGIQASAGALTAGRLRMDALANNIANADTPGFRAEQVSLQPGGGALLGAGAQQGAIEQTDQPLDLALDGPGFFQVRRPNGQVALTRAGQFTTNANGQIVTPEGDQLLPPLQLPAGTDASALSVASNGAVTVNGSPIGTVSVVDVPAPGGLFALGGGLYAAGVASGPARPTTAAQVQQGALEGSTTDPIGSMVDLISTRDTFALNVKALQAQDEVLRATLNIGAPRSDS